MTINNDFIQLISYQNNLNQEQFRILNLSDCPKDWEQLIQDKEISKNDANLLMLLKGDLSQKAQKQIIKNYHTILEFNNIKAKSVIK